MAELCDEPAWTPDPAMAVGETPLADALGTMKRLLLVRTSVFNVLAEATDED